ncbi:probable nuclear transport factor 2 [Drosophila takahashii]|uniref:probable nuclear transport factor 2 n=1 Tax=Drosophila takahashii TaxID=29030 RepID=UPI001CF8D5A4|nr:uncharacterized protein LOC123003235 [Drosophila takahashii]
MSLNSHYEEIGKVFVQQYCAIFDDPLNRANVVSATDFFMTFEDQHIRGGTKVLEKVQSLNFQKIVRVITTPHSFSQFFLLRPNDATSLWPTISSYQHPKLHN